MKDPRQKAIKSLIDSKGLNSLKEVFTVLPMTVIKDALKMNYNTLRNRINKPETLVLKDIIYLADYLDVNPTDILRLALNDIQSQNKIRKK